MRIFLLLAITLSLSACVQPGMYKWGTYEQDLHRSYADPNHTKEMQLKLESHISTIEAERQKVAPGLYAELGTLYLQEGNSAKAKQFYGKERDAWPESKGLMTALIQNIERRDQAKAEASK